MKTLTDWPVALAMVAAGMLIGCSHTMKSPDISRNIRQGLDQAGLKKVTVVQDREQGVVTLGGQVSGDGGKTRAELIAASFAGEEVIANQIAVIPVGAERESKTVSADLDKGIEADLDAALVRNRLHDGVKFSVKNLVVTLTGEVHSQPERKDVQAVAVGVPNVQQVVNELQVKNQRASSSQ